jgi:hypothetical protein
VILFCASCTVKSGTLDPIRGGREPREQAESAMSRQAVRAEGNWAVRRTRL